MFQPKPRTRLILGKFRVLQRTGRVFRLQLGGTTEMEIQLPIDGVEYDVRPGDMLTLYTEVLVNPPKGK